MRENKMKKVYNVFDCEKLEILLETEDIEEANKRLEEEKKNGKDVIRGVKFK
jgi:hypothetical protein